MPQYILEEHELNDTELGLEKIRNVPKLPQVCGMLKIEELSHPEPARDANQGVAVGMSRRFASKVPLDAN